MEGADVLVFRAAAVGVVGGAVVADADHLDALKGQHAPGFGPAAVVADEHAEDAVAPGGNAPGGEAAVAVFEVALFELVEAVAGARFDGAGEVDFAVDADFGAVGGNEHRTVEVLSVRGALGVAEIEADLEFAGAVEQALDGRVGHGGFEVGLEFVAAEQPAGEEGGESEFGEDGELCAFAGGAFEQVDHAGEDGFAGVGALVGSHLGGGDADDAGHGVWARWFAAGETGRRSTINASPASGIFRYRGWRGPGRRSRWFGRGGLFR